MKLFYPELTDPDQITIQQIIKSHARRYPDWRVEDLYKLIYQAAMGNEHAVTNENGARNWLKHELTTLGDGPQEPLLETISPDAEILRVHLRPLLKTRLELELLLQAFLYSSTIFRGSKEILIGYMKCAVKMSEEKELALSPPQVIKFFSEMRNLALPAVHHSPTYQEHYKPAYRVVARAALPAIFFSQHQELNQQKDIA